MLEGEYATWNHIWTTDLGAGVNLDAILVDNLGFCYVADSGAGNGWVIDFAGAVTVLAAFNWYFLFEWETFSATRKYVLGNRGAFPSEFSVYRDGVFLFRRDVILDEADAAMIFPLAVSPSGKMVVLLVTSTATGNIRYVMLYEGV